MEFNDEELVLVNDGHSGDELSMSRGSDHTGKGKCRQGVQRTRFYHFHASYSKEP
jgi:hypothetical protein